MVRASLQLPTALDASRKSGPEGFVEFSQPAQRLDASNKILGLESGGPGVLSRTEAQMVLHAAMHWPFVREIRLCRAPISRVLYE